MGRVDGKVAIVTGAARNMGFAFARLLVAEGAKVMLSDMLDTEGQERADSLGGSARFLHHDVTSEAGWKQVVSETEAAFGPVTVLINNAAISNGSSIEDLEEAEYRRVIDANQTSVFLGMKSVLPSMKRAGGGSIINMSSVAGLVGTANLIAYTAAKFAVRGMTKAAAIELAPHNIRINSIHPGIISRPDAVFKPGMEAIYDAATKATPLGRMGEPDEIANVVLMLASNESSYATGAEFVIDGGASAK